MQTSGETCFAGKKGMQECPLYAWMAPIYIWMSTVFWTPPYDWMPPVCLDTSMFGCPQCLDTSICLDAPCMFVCPHMFGWPQYI